MVIKQSCRVIGDSLSSYSVEGERERESERERERERERMEHREMKREREASCIDPRSAHAAPWIPERPAYSVNYISSAVN